MQSRGLYSGSFDRKQNKRLGDATRVTNRHLLLSFRNSQGNKGLVLRVPYAAIFLNPRRPQKAQESQNDVLVAATPPKNAFSLKRCPALSL